MFGFGKDKDKKKEPAKGAAKPASLDEQLFAPQPAPSPPPPAPDPFFSPPPPQAPPQQAAPLFAPAPQPVSAPQASVADYRTRAATKWQAHELGCTEQQLEAAYEFARERTAKGAPFGGALWGKLVEVCNNQQAVDDMVDELPNEAFGMLPGEHFGVMIRCWANKTSPKNEWAPYRQLALAAGWRPGDVNAIQLFEQFSGPPTYVAQARHPLGLDVLPEEITLAPMESAVYGFLARQLEAITQKQKPTLQ